MRETIQILLFKKKSRNGQVTEDCEMKARDQKTKKEGNDDN